MSSDLNEYWVICLLDESNFMILIIKEIKIDNVTILDCDT